MNSENPSCVINLGSLGRENKPGHLAAHRGHLMGLTQQREGLNPLLELGIAADAADDPRHPPKTPPNSPKSAPARRAGNAEPPQGVLGRFSEPF